jgi:hypothetical protein
MNTMHRSGLLTEGTHARAVTPAMKTGSARKTDLRQRKDTQHCYKPAHLSGQSSISYLYVNV